MVKEEKSEEKVVESEQQKPGEVVKEAEDVEMVKEEEKEGEKKEESVAEEKVEAATEEGKKGREKFVLLFFENFNLN